MGFQRRRSRYVYILAHDGGVDTVALSRLEVIEASPVNYCVQ
jgi:hypothetical protein